MKKFWHVFRYTQNILMKTLRNFEINRRNFEINRRTFKKHFRSSLQLFLNIYIQAPALLKKVPSWDLKGVLFSNFSLLPLWLCLLVSLSPNGTERFSKTMKLKFFLFLYWEGFSQNRNKYSTLQCRVKIIVHKIKLNLDGV